MMKKLPKSICLVGLTLVALPQFALAETSSAKPSAAPQVPIVQGLAVANLNAIVPNSNAFLTAQQQRRVTYKSQYDAAEARRQQLNSQLQPLIDKFNRDRQASNANQVSIQQQAETIQRMQQSGLQELQRLLGPMALSEAYVEEQVRDKLDLAIKVAMSKRGISIVMTPANAIAFNNAYDLSPAILAELNALIPTAQLTPPPGWSPRKVREASAAQQAKAATQNTIN